MKHLTFKPYLVPEDAPEAISYMRGKHVELELSERLFYFNGHKQPGMTGGILKYLLKRGSLIPIKETTK